MKVYSDKIEEYKKRHNPIWPELEEVLKIHGVRDYSIFLDRKTNTLIGYALLESEEKWNAIADTEICKKWWASMADLMETNPDNSPVTIPLENIFNSSNHKN